MAIMHSESETNVFLKPSLQSRHGLSACFKGCAQGSLSSEPTSVLDLASTISPVSSPGTSPNYLNNPGIAAPSLHKSIVHKTYHHMQNLGIYDASLIQSLSHNSYEVDNSIASSPTHSINAFEFSSALSDGCDAILSSEPQNESLHEVLEDLHVNLGFEVDAKSTLDDIFADSPSFASHDTNVWDENDTVLLDPDEFMHVQGSLWDSMSKGLSSKMQGRLTQYKTWSSPSISMYGSFDRQPCHSPAFRMQRPFEQVQSPCGSQFSTEFVEYASGFTSPMGNCRKCNFSQCKCYNTTWMEGKPSEEQQRQEEYGLELVHLLLLCARMIGEKHNKQVQPILRRLQKMSSPYGEPLERIAHYVSEALLKSISYEISCEKECNIPPTMTVPLRQLLLQNHSTSLEQEDMEIDAFHLALYQALPYTRFLHFTANQAILEAVAESSHIHVIDFDIQQGIQWPSLFQSLAVRPRGPPKMVRLSVIGTCSRRLNQTGMMLAEFAKTLDLNFTFHPIVAANVKEVNVGMLASAANDGQFYEASCSDAREAIALNLSAILHSPMWDGVTTEMVMSLVRKLHPKVVTIIKAERQNEAVSYVDKFSEMLFYHSAFFDSMEASLARRSPDRERIERVFLSYGLKDIISMAEKEEADNSIMRLSTEKWQALMNRHGFHSLEFSSHALYQAKLLLNLYASQDFRVECTQATPALSINWQQIPLFSVLAFSSCYI